MSEEQEAHTRFWQALAGIAFSLWAVLVPISAKWVVDSLKEMSAAQMVFAQEAARRNELTEGRISRIEERQTFIMRELQRLALEHDNGDHPVGRR